MAMSKYFGMEASKLARGFDLYLGMSFLRLSLLTYLSSWGNKTIIDFGWVVSPHGIQCSGTFSNSIFIKSLKVETKNIFIQQMMKSEM